MSLSRPSGPWWPLVAICLGTFMLLVDVTIVNVALPSIATSLGSSFADLQWVIDGYALALAALLMVAGSLADRFGRRRLYLLGLLVFSAASLACGLAPNALFLVVARIVQGTGAAAMFATTGALIPSLYRGRRRGVAFGVWGAVNGLAAASGPLLGGLLTEALGWQAIFWVNLPVAAVAVLVTRAVVTESANPAAGRIDLWGAVTFTLAVASLVYGLVSAGENGWDTPRTVAGLALAAVALVVFLVVESVRTAPMLDLRLFRRGPFTALMIGGAVLNGAAFAHLTFTSIWLQSVLGLGPIAAGLTTAPLALASFVVSLTAARRFTRGHPAYPVGGGLALVGTGALLMSLVGPGSGPWVLLAGLVTTGLGVGAVTPVLVSATLAAVPADHAGMGSAAVNTFRQLGLAVGLALFGTVFTARLTAVVTDAGVPNPEAIGNALAGGRAAAVLGQRPELSALVHRAFAAGLDGVFTAAGVTALLAAVLVFVLLRLRTSPVATDDRPERTEQSEDARPLTAQRS